MQTTTEHNRRTQMTPTDRVRYLVTRMALGSALVVPALAAPMLVGVSPALANCVNTAGAVVCATDDTNGFPDRPGVVPAGDITDLTVNSGVTVDDSTADISGFVSGIVEVNGDVTGTLLINGTIRDLGAAADGIQVDDILNRLINNGTISGGDDGVHARIINSLINSGSISGGSDGVFTFDPITTLTNSGTITGGTDDGVRVNDDITSLTNSGTISGGDDGVEALGDIASLTNSGTISGGDDGVRAFAGNIGTLTNSGTITGGVDGIGADTVSSLTNSGTISGGLNGVDVITLNSLTNSGTISGGTDGITAIDIASVTNSGTISGSQFAIQDRAGVDTTLTLNAGSVLIGRVDLGSGTNTLNIGQGLSLNSRFEDPDGFSTVPVIGTTSGHLVAILDQANGGGGTDRQIVAVDPSAFASMDDALAALTAGIGQTVQGRQAALRSDPALGFASRFAAAEETSLAAFSDLDLDAAPHLNPNRFWIEAFGAYRQDDGDRVGREFDHLSGGLVAGVDVPVDALTSVGVMAGFAASTSENEIDTQQTDTTSFYAGVYASTQAMGLAWDASLTVGYTDYEQQRITANNLVAGGLETASADFGGWFINPQLTATNTTFTGSTATTMGFALSRVEQSLTLSYAGLFLDGYTETGTTNPLTLNDRDVHVASARAALALPFERVEADGALTTVRLIGGVQARTQFGDDGVSGTLLGQAVSTTLSDDDAAFGGFVGLAAEYQTTTGLTAYANAEALLETDSAYQLSGAIGLRIAF